MQQQEALLVLSEKDRVTTAVDLLCCLLPLPYRPHMFLARVLMAGSHIIYVYIYLVTSP